MRLGGTSPWRATYHAPAPRGGTDSQDGAHKEPFLAPPADPPGGRPATAGCQRSLTGSEASVERAPLLPPRIGAWT
jgi:hypothetical protein